MPATARARQAVAAADVQLADRAAATGRQVSYERIRRWRLVGLLPAPEQVVPRPGTAPTGRHARIYSPDQLPLVDRLVAVLADHARSRLGPLPLALIVFAHGAPVDPELLRTAVNSRLRRLRGKLDAAAKHALARTPSPADGLPKQSRGFDIADALAQTLANAPAAAPFRRQLRAAGRPVTTADLTTALFVACLAIFGGTSDERAGLTTPTEDDNPNTPVDDLMHATGTHGLLETTSDGVGPIIAGGPTAVIDAISSTSALALQPLPDDVTAAELIAAREVCQLLDAVLTAIPVPLLRHLLAADPLTAFWDPNDPDKIASAITVMTQLERAHPGQVDTVPLVAAFTAAGWSPPGPWGRPYCGQSRSRRTTTRLRADPLIRHHVEPHRAPDPESVHLGVGTTERLGHPLASLVSLALGAYEVNGRGTSSPPLLPGRQEQLAMFLHDV